MQKRLFALIGLALVLVDRPALARSPTQSFLTLGAEIEPPRGFVEMCSKLRNVCDSFRVESTAANSDDDRSDSIFERTEASLNKLPSVPWLALRPTGAILDNQPFATANEFHAAMTSDAIDLAQSRPMPSMSLDFNQSLPLPGSPAKNCLAVSGDAGESKGWKFEGLPWATPSVSPTLSLDFTSSTGPFATLLSLLDGHGIAQPKPCKTRSHAFDSGTDASAAPPLYTLINKEFSPAHANLALPMTVIEPAATAPIIHASESSKSNFLEILAHVNKHVNSHVRQQSDIATYGVGELWRPSGDGPRAAGDCEDLAIEKRLELIAAHFPPENLFFAVVYGTNIGLHTVLIARLDNGDVVLDSRTPYIEPWTRSGYKWLAIEKPGNPEVWLRSS